MKEKRKMGKTTVSAAKYLTKVIEGEWSEKRKRKKNYRTRGCKDEERRIVKKKGYRTNGKTDEGRREQHRTRGERNRKIRSEDR